MKRALRMLACLSVVAACSTLAPKPPEVECIANEDCDEVAGFVCELGVCRDGGDKPPYAIIGFDLQEVAGAQVQFRGEIAGCDREVLSEGTAIRVLTLPRRELARRLELGVVLSPDDTPLPSSFTLTQGSRFARDPNRRQIAFTSPEDLEAGVVSVAWPRYLVDNVLPDFLEVGGYLLWQTQPQSIDDATPRALRYQHLALPVSTTGEDARECVSDLDCCLEAEGCEPDEVRNACVTSLGACRPPFNDAVQYTYFYADACDRPLRGQVFSVDEQLTSFTPLPGTSVAMRHADPEGVAPLGLPRLDVLPVDMRDAECGPSTACADGLVCNTQSKQCEYPLAGLAAWTGTVPLESAPGLEGQFDARVYTYCEGLPTGEPLQRSFDVTITPLTTPEQPGMPSITFRANVDFAPLQAGGQKPTASFGGNLCVPTPGPTQPVTLALSGEPRTLLTGYTCCDIDCLPRTEADASVLPEPRTQCAGGGSGATASFRVESPVVLPPELLEAWNAEDSPCVGVQAAADGTVGVLRRSGACGTIDDTGTTTPQCELSLPSNPGAAPRDYALRIETPTGSVSGSLDTTLKVDPATGITLHPIDLPNRVMVFGRVIVEDCVGLDETDGDCGSPGAKILAERLRMDGESEANTPGPYFHEVPTFFDPTQSAGSRAGAYRLPLDPGVWLITALPDSGTSGGPAPIAVLDLRSAEPEFERDLFLEPGILVTLDVSSFDRRAQVIPLDIGSYEDLRDPDRGTPLDLGAAGECLSSDGPTVGCRIRRLVGGSSLPPSQIGQVRFTARDLDSNAEADCSE